MSRQALVSICTAQFQNIVSLIKWGHLPLIFAAALVLTLFLASGNVTAEMLFQSPQSPPAEEAAAEEAAPAPAEETGETTVEQQQSPLPQPTDEIIQSPLPPPQSPVATPLPPVQPSTLEPLQQPTPLPYATSTQSSDTPMVLDEAELIDTLVVSGAYIWLCCGLIMFLLIPLFMIILYIRGRGKIVKEESF